MPHRRACAGVVHVEQAERRFRAMGCQAHLIVNADQPGLLDLAERRLALLERRWSRGLPESELGRMNTAEGRPVRVSTDTARIVQRAAEAWEVTGGLFDPTLRQAMPAPGCAGIEVEGDVVALPAGLRLDLGGIGKGYAADQVAYELRKNGATGACVNLGGYVRVSGPYSGDTGWAVDIDDPFDAEDELTTVTLTEGAVATSRRRQRRWRRAGEEPHQLIDPRTGRPSDSSLVAVTVVAAQTHWAEVLAKAALVGGEDDGRRLLEAHGLSALLVRGDGEVLRVGSIREYEPWTTSPCGTSGHVV
jgi:thiamine biosynthesis lipoprotein